MRYITFLLAFSLFSCSSDDTKSTVSPELAGFYNMVDAELERPLDYNGDGVASTQLRDEVPSCFHMTLWLLDDFRLAHFSDAIIVNGDDYTFDCETLTSYFGIWAQDGDFIVQHGNDGVSRREPFYFQGKDIIVERQDSIFGKMTIHFDRTSL